ncbi:hypothetical protein TSUD_234670 [Trifolium subterraneum]|uniref:Uncharacterized protein n=1 Tax=Trifolium subterraneum TaxID=3900 RepID=A0A2Z6MHP1_TRISU|nr:hypothetical protein TSUD_234670 [Trifolium subterraneum]
MESSRLQRHKCFRTRETANISRKGGNPHMLFQQAFIITTAVISTLKEFHNNQRLSSKAT